MSCHCAECEKIARGRGHGRYCNCHACRPRNACRCLHCRPADRPTDVHDVILESTGKRPATASTLWVVQLDNELRIERVVFGPMRVPFAMVKPLRVKLLRAAEDRAPDRRFNVVESETRPGATR